VRSRQGKIGDRHRVFDLILKDRLFLSIRILREDDDFLQKYITSERVFRSIMNEKEWIIGGC
jgi:hypothetical protein